MVYSYKLLKIIMTLGITLILTNYVPLAKAEEKKVTEGIGASYLHGGISINRLNNDVPGWRKLLQINGSMEASFLCENASMKDWQKRAYLYLGIDRKKNMAVGLGYYIVIGGCGVQIIDLYNKEKNKDFIGVGIYIDGNVLDQVWKIIKN